MNDTDRNLLTEPERQLLDALGIDAHDVQRKSEVLLDIYFWYEHRTVHNGRLETRHTPAWLPLVLIKLAFDRHQSQVAHMAYGHPLPRFAHEWSRMLDLPPEQTWTLCGKVWARWFATREQAAEFAQP
jgi:hypothetical protein